MNDRAIGGCSLLIKDTIPHDVIPLNTALQAVAVKVSLHKTFTICTIYIPPHLNLAQCDIDNLVNQLPAPYLLIGDFNAHSELWGCSSNDSRGKKIEELLQSSDVCLLNSKAPTYLHPASGSLTSIDISLCSASIALDFAWCVHSDQCGSDHYPILIDIIQPVPKDNVPRWNLKQADWAKFKLECSQSINRNTFEEHNEKFPLFLTKLNTVATECIPKSKGDSTKKHNPWFNDDCKDAIKVRQRALDKCRTQPTSENLTEYRNSRAKAEGSKKKFLARLHIKIKH